LLNQNFAVQLVHCTQETSWADHGFVRVKSDDGQLLSEVTDYQHNGCNSGHQSNTKVILSEVLAKHPLVRQPPAKLAAKGWPGLPPGKKLNREDRMKLMALKYHPYEGTSFNGSMRQAPKESVQGSSRRPMSLARRGSGSSIMTFANNGQQVLQHRRRSNSTTR